MLGILIGLTAILGLAVGSFVAVVIYAVPRGLSITLARSTCLVCGSPIREPGSLSVAAWFRSKGRCPECSQRISARNRVVELSCGALFAGTASRFGYSWDLPAYLVLFAGLLTLSCIDAEMMLLPRKIVYPLTTMVALLLIVAAAATGRWHDLLVAALCAVGWFAVFLAINVVNERLLGFGDVRLAPVLGLSLGWLGVDYVFLGFFAANLIGAAIGIALVSMKRKMYQTRMPYGAFLSFGCALAVFTGPELLGTFTNRI